VALLALQEAGLACANAGATGADASKKKSYTLGVAAWINTVRAMHELPSVRVHELAAQRHAPLVPIRFEEQTEEEEKNKATTTTTKQVLDTFKVTCFGGTFDMLHDGHKVLISMGLLLATESLVIGLSTDAVVAPSTKQFAEVRQPYALRLLNLRHVMHLVSPRMHVEIVPLEDPAGPSATYAHMHALILSEETIKGGPYVNKLRAANKLAPLAPVVVRCVGGGSLKDKVSSTARRKLLVQRQVAHKYYHAKHWFQQFNNTIDDDDDASHELLQKWFLDVHARYADEKQRAYHTETHLEKLLRWFDECRASLRRPHIVELAIWFHDAVYEPRAATAGDNERRSAALFMRFAKELGTAVVSAQDAKLVEQYILATIGHKPPEGSATKDDVDTDLHFFLDMDLSILGECTEQYNWYAAGIQQEYASDTLPLRAYYAARNKVMRGFLQRKRLFLTEFFHASPRHFERYARFNVANEIAQNDAAAAALLAALPASTSSTPGVAAATEGGATATAAAAAEAKT
jgi:predicted metal-dependent HD superfamily phosphohydrolase/phosphopantetheine adenylyltransferase